MVILRIRYSRVTTFPCLLATLKTKWFPSCASDTEWWRQSSGADLTTFDSSSSPNIPSFEWYTYISNASSYYGISFFYFTAYLRNECSDLCNKQEEWPFFRDLRKKYHRFSFLPVTYKKIKLKPIIYLYKKFQCCLYLNSYWVDSLIIILMARIWFCTPYWYVTWHNLMFCWL